MHQCSHEHCHQQYGPRYGNNLKGRNKGANLLKHPDRGGGRRDERNVQPKWNNEVLNQHVTCVITRRTWVDDEITYTLKSYVNSDNHLI